MRFVGRSEVVMILGDEHQYLPRGRSAVMPGLLSGARSVMLAVENRLISKRESQMVTVSGPALIVLLVIAAVCGGVGRALAGGGGGLITSIALGFIGVDRWGRGLRGHPSPAEAAIVAASLTKNPFAPGGQSSSDEPLKRPRNEYPA